MRLSFTAKLALDVVEGRKRDTYRRPMANPPTVGDRCGFCVNAGRPDIGRVEVTAVELVAADDLDPARRELVAGMVGAAPEYLRIGFRLIEVRRPQIARQNLRAFAEYLGCEPAGVWSAGV
ncbi:MAG TPA: ASCH domain-containing protein [Humisphaera sp.]